MQLPLCVSGKVSAGAGRLLLDELRLCAALGRRHAPKNLNTLYVLTKRFNKI
jgi:hypothetical protein